MRRTKTHQDNRPVPPPLTSPNQKFYYASFNSSQLPMSYQDPEEDLDDNTFYTTLKRDYPKIFHRVSVICVPHSRSIVGLKMDRGFIETHSLSPSPFFQGQYMSINGKVVSIERKSVKAISGFKEERTARILSELSVYIEGCSKQTRVLIIERPLEGGGKASKWFRIPKERNHEKDLEFMQSFPNNTQSLVELTHAIAEFNETYVYVRGYAESAVDKVTQIWEKAVQNLLKYNSTIMSICSSSQHEYDCFMELVENILMSKLHNKIFFQSLCPIYNPRDNYLESIISAYGRARITLRDYNVGERFQDMPEEMLDTACKTLACLDEDDSSEYSPSSSFTIEEEPCEKIPAKTPLEKLICTRRAIQEISEAAKNFLGLGTVADGADDRPLITTDDFIPLLAYVIVHSRIRKLASILFYMETFRLSRVTRSDDLSFALATLKSSTEFLKSDPLAIHDSASTTSSISSISSMPTSSQSRGRSTSSISSTSSMLTSDQSRDRSTSVSSLSTIYQSSQNASFCAFSTPNGIDRDKSPARSISSVSSMPACSRTNSRSTYHHGGEYRQPINEDSNHSGIIGSSLPIPGTSDEPGATHLRRRPSNLVIKRQIIVGARNRKSMDSDQLSLCDSISSVTTVGNAEPALVLLPLEPLISSPDLPDLMSSSSFSSSSKTAIHVNSSKYRHHSSGRSKRSAHQNSSQPPAIIRIEKKQKDIGEFLSRLTETDGTFSWNRSCGSITQY